MLVLTTDAASVIRSLVEQAELPDEAGLRITAHAVGDQQAALELSVAGEPDARDAVVEREGAHVFLEPVVADALADKVLDAAVEGDGVRFTLSQQDEAPPAADGDGQPG